MGWRIARTCALAGALCAIWASSAPAIEYVDGISDQSIATWDDNTDGYFTSVFAKEWIVGGHIRYVRYVAQWNAMLEPSSGPNPNGDDREKLEAWYDDVETHMPGLTLDLALTNYEEGGRIRPTAAAYRDALTRLLRYATATRIVEPWNEPDNGGEVEGLATATYVNPTQAAAYAKQAASVCVTHGCTVVAGDLLDCEKCQMVNYEQEYRDALNGWTFHNWGMHPYEAVKRESPATVAEFTENWGDGASSLWFTEIGAYECEDYGSTVTWTESQQSEHAQWLVKKLIMKADHVFYYEFLDGYGEQPQKECEERPGKPDTALYVPSGNPSAPDRPRPAAAWIFGDRGDWPYPLSAFPRPGSVEGALTLTSPAVGGTLEGSTLSFYGAPAA